MNKLILGLWTLQSWEVTNITGKKMLPYGENPRGYLYYAADGFMSVSLASVYRKALDKPSVFEMTDAEYKAMYENYASYCGTYEIIDNVVHHHIKMMSLVDWENTTQIRNFKLIDDQLILSHKLQYKGEEVDSVLVWATLNKKSGEKSWQFILN